MRENFTSITMFRQFVKFFRNFIFYIKISVLSFQRFKRIKSLYINIMSTRRRRHTYSKRRNTKKRNIKNKYKSRRRHSRKHRGGVPPPPYSKEEYNLFIKHINENISDPTKKELLLANIRNMPYETNYESPFTGDLIEDPYDQGIARIQAYNKYTHDWWEN